MIKEMDCFNCFPGDITKINREALNNLLSRTEPDDNQRKTSIYYLYADDNLLGGK